MQSCFQHRMRAGCKLRINKILPPWSRHCRKDFFQANFHLLVNGHDGLIVRVF